MNYEDDQRAYEDTGVRMRNEVDTNETDWRSYARRGPRWADVPEKEKWKYTIGVGIRLFAINAGLGVLFFLILLVAV